MADKHVLFPQFLQQALPRIDATLEAKQPQVGADAARQASIAHDLEHFLYAPLAAFVAAGGKRTRPALVLLGAQAVAGEAAFDPHSSVNQDFLYAAACAIEDFQSAALIHDDIADEGELRRGVPCVHRTQGIGPAINVGDLALVSVIERVLEAGATPGSQEPVVPNQLRLQVAHELIDMQRRTLEGQALDLCWARDGRWDISVEDYLSMASHKTAYYSAAYPLRIGALCAGGSEAQIAALTQFGMDCGLAFQLQDDLLNLTGNAAAQGKDFRTDITEGKRTMAVCYALSHLSEPDRQELIGLLSCKTSDARELERAVALMEQSGALDAVRKHAHKLVNRAKEAFLSAPVDAEARAILESMADFFVERAG